ncbi:uncharacterized protein A4U43_C10F10670 [Asparagus officinalis]|uniref:Uncharacterized protein n=1 Tax=Asparagus officinalis TaxID=4686 RepID=A0A5P1E559_ASPOF|nr:uncharacterized protein A4U43_C10F10670 [Asparagus officinalis]
MASYCCLHPLSSIPIHNLPPFRPGFEELSDEAKSVALRDSLLQMNEFMEQIKIRVLEIIPLHCCSKCEDEILFMVSEGNRFSTQLRGMLEDLRDRSGPVFKRRRSVGLKMQQF